jgi:O-antigen/teichoic acid export membrane protein
LTAGQLFRTLVNRVTYHGRDYGWSLVAAGIGQGATLLTAVILARTLSGESFGRYVVGQNTVVALGSVFSLGLAFVANAFLARNAGLAPSRALSIHRFCIKVACVSGILGGLLVVTSSKWLADGLFHDSQLRPELVIAGMALPFAVIVTYQTGAMAGLTAFRGLAGAAAAGGVSLVAGASIGGRLAGPSGALIGLLVSHLVRSGVGFEVLRVRQASLMMFKAAHGFAETWRVVRGFALAAFVSGLTGTPAIWLSNAVLATYVDTRAVGVFVSAFLIKTLVTFVPLQFGNVLLSRLSLLSAKGDVSAWRRTHISVLLTGVGIASAFAMPVLLGAEHVMGLFGSGFRQGAGLVRWLMVCAVFEAAATLTYYSFPGRGRMWKATLSYTIPKDLVLVISSLFWIPRVGSIGLAWAHTASWAYGFLALMTLTVLEGHRSDREDAVDAQM